MRQTTIDSKYLVCPHCQVTNRIPTVRLSDRPKCGKCQQPLLTAAPVELTAHSAAKIIQNNEVLTVVDFWASWCQPCLMMAPQFTAAANQKPEVVFAKLQTDKFDQAAQAYQIRSLPTLIAFKSGKVLARHAGVMPSDQIIHWVQGLE